MELQLASRHRRIAVVCQPWDDVAPHSGNSIVIVAYQLARCLAGSSHVVLYGRRGPGQKRCEHDGDTIEFRRLRVLQIPQAFIEISLGVVSCYMKKPIKYMFSYFYHSFYALRVALSVRVAKCDIILVQNFLQFAHIIKILNPRAKICLHMHCEWLTQFATAANERRLRRIDLIIGCSDFITAGIKSRFPNVAARCHTVYNGVDTDRFCPAPVLPSPNDGTERLLYVGRISPEKGVHVLIQAFKILAEKRPRLRLDIVGTANALHYLYHSPDPQDRETASLRVFFGSGLFDMMRRQLILRNRSYPTDLAALASGDQRIVFHGGVVQAETIDFYCRANVLVFPSVWNEPAGMPPCESQACAVPVVATHSGGIPEYVSHGQTGLLVTRGDAEQLAMAIAKLLDDPALTRAMGAAGRLRAVECFSWDVVSRHLADLLENLSPAAPVATMGYADRPPHSLPGY